MKDKPVILVVDDQPQNIELLEAYLVPQGYEIVKAANGEEALEKLSGNQIDLILLDVMMSGMDGFEVTRRVRRDDKKRLLPIILVTSLQETEDRVKGIESGCDDFISKPVDKIELLARVHSLLKVKAYNDLMSNYQKELESDVTRRTEELKHALENLQQEITERKRMQEQMIFNDRLASIGQLASGIAHELNNPLTSVIGFSEMLMKRTDLPDDAKEDLKIVNDEAQRTARVVKGLLTFARRQKAEKEAVEINSIMQNVLQLRSYEHRVSNIEVNIQLTPELPEILGNSGQLQQVFINLIVNAEQAMLEAHNRGTLTIVTERVGDIIKVSVADDGPGISPENMRRLFTPFFTTKEVGKGTGLGLSICHGIVTEHGGRIYAESVGKGTTFVVELPVSKQ